LVLAIRVHFKYAGHEEIWPGHDKAILFISVSWNSKGKEEECTAFRDGCGSCTVVQLYTGRDGKSFVGLWVKSFNRKAET